MKTMRNILSIFLLIILAQSEAQSQKNNIDRNGEGFVNSNGVNIWYKVEGNNSSNYIPIVLIHGGPGATARPFEKTIGPEISKHRKVIYMDYRGAGRSDRPQNPDDYSFEILSDDIEVLRKHLEIEKWAMFGHSNGGATVITYALKYPDHVASIILCDPLISPVDLEMNMVHKVALTPSDQFEEARAIYKSNESNEVRFDKLLDLIDRETRYKFQYYNPKNSDVLNKFQTDLEKEIGKSLMVPALVKGLIQNGLFEFDAFRYANDLTMPLLILLGRYDSEISIDNAMKFALTVPNGYVALLDKSGHHPYLEETEASVEHINSFIMDHSINLDSQE